MKVKMPEAIAICHQNLEFSTLKELSDKISVKGEALEGKGIVYFDTSIDKILEFCYTSQSAYKVLLLLHKGRFESIDDIKKISFDIPFNKKTFIVRCKRTGENDFTTKDVEEAVAKNINLRVDFANPDIIIYAYLVGNEIFIGIDLSGFDLSKRDYKIFSSNNSLKANIAFAVSQRYSTGKVMIDPFCSDGTIIIEAALKATNRSPHFYKKKDFTFLRLYDFDFSKVDDKIRDENLNITGFEKNLNLVKYAQKNAKLAGINKLIRISRAEVEWLDIKKEEASVDYVMSYPPFQSGKKDEAHIRKEYDFLFANSRIILKDGGELILLSRSPALLKEVAEKNGFLVADSREFSTGDIYFSLITFSYR